MKQDFKNEMEGPSQRVKNQDFQDSSKSKNMHDSSLADSANPQLLSENPGQTDKT